MSLENISIIVPGSFYTDLAALGINEFIGPGEQTKGKELCVYPGGKSRNVAQMISLFTGQDTVAMIGKTSQDYHNLWKLPVDALKEAGVNIDYVEIEDFETTGKFPGVCLVKVDIHGNNKIYLLPGINEDFAPSCVDRALSLFDVARTNSGMVVLSLETPLETVLYSMSKAKEYGLNVLLDPGALDKNVNYDELLQQEIFLIKPNEHEAKILTGIEVKDFESARQAAEYFLGKKVENVFITVGKEGAYLFNKDLQLHIPAPKLEVGEVRNATGCGDQVMATLCAFLSLGKSLKEAAKLAILTGTLQFCKEGIVPVTKEELKKYSCI